MATKEESVVQEGDQIIDISEEESKVDKSPSTIEIEQLIMISNPEDQIDDVAAKDS